MADSFVHQFEPFLATHLNVKAIYNKLNNVNFLHVIPSIIMIFILSNLADMLSHLVIFCVTSVRFISLMHIVRFGSKVQTVKDCVC